MISDEERMKVVKALREPSNPLDIHASLYNALGTCAEAVATTVPADFYKHNNRRLLNRLADLIEPQPKRTKADIERDVLIAKMNGTPLRNLTEEQKDMVRPYVERTCKMHDASMSTHTVWACSSCGEDIAPQFPGTFNYCPNCGAKVVE